MNILLFYSHEIYRTARKFYYDERGVYTVITGLMGFLLLGLIALVVDGSGLLLDKARLSQGMEQAAIALVTENNELGKRNHSEITKLNPTQDEINKFGGSGSPEDKKFKAQIYMRNQNLAKGIVSLYMRSYKPGYKPTEIIDNFDIKCKVHSLGGNNAVNKVSVCRVDGAINRNSWLPLEGNSLTFHEKEKISSDRYYAVKRDSVLIPLDVMLVNDFSGSMNERVAGAVKLEVLRSVVGELGDLLIPGKNTNVKNVSPFNRIGYVNFSQGAPQNDGKSLCVSPFYGKEKVQEIEVPRMGFNMFTFGPYGRRDWKAFEVLYRDVIPAGSFDVSSCKQKTVWLEDDMRPTAFCKVKANPTAVMAKAMRMLDVRTIEYVFNQYFDPAKTVSQISTFDGRTRNYELYYNMIDAYCLGRSNIGKPVTSAWFTQEKNNIKGVMGQVSARGGTAVSTGFLIGSNILMGTNPDVNASPAKVGTNTQKVLLVLSDGMDNFPKYDTLPKLVDAGACDAIKNRVEQLQDSRYEKLPLRIGFVAFGYDPRKAVEEFVKKYGFNGSKNPERLTTRTLKKIWYDAEGAVKQANAWEKCVGKDNYYLANTRNELMEAFKQIISTKDRVGRAMTNSPIADF